MSAATSIRGAVAGCPCIRPNAVEGSLVFATRFAVLCIILMWLHTVRLVLATALSAKASRSAGRLLHTRPLTAKLCVRNRRWLLLNPCRARLGVHPIMLPMLPTFRLLTCRCATMSIDRGAR